MSTNKTKFNNHHKLVWIPHSLTILRYVVTLAIVLILLIQPYEWTIDNGWTGIAHFDIDITFKFTGIDYTFRSVFYVQYFVAGGLFVIGCITDFLDTYLSKKLKCQSLSWLILETVADQLLVNMTLGVLSNENLVYVWITLIIVARDIIVDATWIAKATKGEVFKPGIWPELKTKFLMLGILVFFCAFHRVEIMTLGNPQIIRDINEHETYNPVNALSNIGLYIAVVFAIISCVIRMYDMISPRMKKKHLIKFDEKEEDKKENNTSKNHKFLYKNSKSKQQA